MKKVLATMTSAVFLASLSVTVSSAQTSCPPEVAQAKTLLEQRQQVSRTQDVNAPRSLAGARTQDVNAPRTQDVNAPRVQEVQAPRSLAGARTQDVNAPRTQDVNAPRSSDPSAPRGDISRAASLVREAEAACKAGHSSVASEKAKAAIEIIKK